MREVVESFITTQVQPPAPDSLPHGFGSPGTDRWRDVDKVLPPAIPGPSRAKRIPQKIKALLSIRPLTVCILAINNLGLGRMQFQGALRQSLRNAGLELVGLPFTCAMHEEVSRPGESHPQALSGRVEGRRACCRWRVSSPTLSIAGWVHNSVVSLNSRDGQIGNDGHNM